MKVRCRWQGGWEEKIETTEVSLCLLDELKKAFCCRFSQSIFMGY